MDYKKIQRSHDSLYLDPREGQIVKQSFVEIGDLIEDISHKPLNLTDIGCATGLMPNYLSERFPNLQVVGREFRLDLISEGQSRYPNLMFEHCDVRDSESLISESVDIITMSGVLQIFDNWQHIMENVLLWLKPNGRAVIHGLFNPWAYDVWIKYNESENSNFNELEAGWNIVSVKSMSDYLAAKECLKFRFKNFQINVDIERRADDPIRSWTEENGQFSKDIFNGLCIRQPHKFLIIDKY